MKSLTQGFQIRHLLHCDSVEVITVITCLLRTDCGTVLGMYVTPAA